MHVQAHILLTFVFCFQDELKEAYDAVMKAIRIALFTDRPDLPDGLYERVAQLLHDDLLKILYTDPEIDNVRFFKKNKQGNKRAVAYPNPGKGKNRQGARGMTQESGMLDLWGINPTALFSVMKRICRDLNRQVWIGKERISARGNKSNKLPPHHDCPLFKKPKK